MKIIIETYRLLRKMGMFNAYSTQEIVDMTKKQRCAVLKRLHRLETGGFVEAKPGENAELYWRVIKMPNKPAPLKVWKESKSLTELAAENK